MEKASKERAGFALPATIGALVIIGVLVTAGFYMARQELRIGVATNHSHMAVNFAQAGANEIMANWNGYQLTNIPLWSDTTLTGTVNGGTWSVTVAKTSEQMFYLTATGDVTQGGELWSGASRTIGIVTKLLFADINPPGALMTRGPVKVQGSGEINGMDEDPGGWGGYCDANQDMPGLVIDDEDNISGGGDITGTPPWVEDPTLVAETFTTFGDMDWDELTELAALEGKNVSGLGGNINGTGPTLTGGGECDESDPQNWGDPSDPSAPCGSYFPLIYHDSDLTIQSGGTGQGVLLVEGDLDLRGGYTFYGIIIVQGAFSTQGTETVHGAVMASNATLDMQGITGTSEVQYSSCAVHRALLNNASLSRARPLAQRSWVDLSAVLN